jgi:hypothetical protein
VELIPAEEQGMAAKKPCSKQPFADRFSAVLEAQRLTALKRVEMNEYPCQRCGAWHITAVKATPVFTLRSTGYYAKSGGMALSSTELTARLPVRGLPQAAIGMSTVRAKPSPWSAALLNS